MQRGCEGWSVSRSASGELSGLLLAHFEGQSLCLLLSPSTPNLTFLKFLKFIKLAAARRGKKLLCHTTPPWKHPGSVSGACPRFYILLEVEHLVSAVPRGGRREHPQPPPPPSPPPHSLSSCSGLLVMQGFWLQEVGWCVSREGFLSL